MRASCSSSATAPCSGHSRPTSRWLLNSATLDRLYLGLAHDLRSPLNSIVLHLELLKSGGEDGEDRPSPQMAERLEVLEEETRRLSQALDAVLAQTVQPTSEAAQFDLRELVGELAGLLHGQLRQQGVELEISLAEEELLVSARKDRLLRALLNVAVNGVEVSGDGDELTLSTGRDGEWATLRVGDRGPGIPSPVQERVFDLHFTTKSSGSGLGLYVARTAVEAEGGTLDVQETSPEGTVFELRMPLVDGDEA